MFKFNLRNLRYNTQIFFTIEGIQMSRRCAISGKGPMSGNNVSHAKN